MVRLTVVLVIPLALSEAMKTATFAISSRVMSRRGWVLLASISCHFSSEDAIVAKFASAWESADLDGLVALLTDDVFISMPPMPFEYEGRDLVTRFRASLFGAGRKFDLVRTRANGQPAFGAYLRGPTGIRLGVGLYVLTLTGDRICAMIRFENGVLPWFGLPITPEPITSFRAVSCRQQNT